MAGEVATNPLTKWPFVLAVDWVGNQKFSGNKSTSGPKLFRFLVNISDVGFSEMLMPWEKLVCVCYICVFVYLTETCRKFKYELPIFLSFLKGSEATLFIEKYDWSITSSCCSVAKSCLILWDPMDCSTPGSPVLHSFPELVQIHVHWVGDAI